MIQDRTILVLYTTAVCNLNCRYCYIDKNPALKTIDDILDESFRGDYYFNYAREIFPDPKQLKEIQIWGGEPSLGYHRAYHTIEKLIPCYPELDTLMTSTNFTTPNFFEEFYGLLKIFEKFSPRKFKISLQLSIDGPEEINDISRGKDVTKQFIKHFEKMLTTIKDNLPSNVTLFWHFKPTLDSGTIKLLQTKQKIIEYFQFFEQFYEKAESYKMPNFEYGYSIPNTACPSPHTKEDGILFANYCKLCRELEKENKTHHYFKFYNNIISFFPRRPPYDNNNYKSPGGVCGTGKQVVGLLPYNMISACHNGFVDLISDYKIESSKRDKASESSLDFRFFANDKAKARLTMTKEELLTYESQINYYYQYNTKTRLGNIAQLINLLALVNQIDEKYKNHKEALKGAQFITAATSYCIRDNINSTGCMSLYPVGLIKLLLNGAREYIEE